MPSRSYHTFLFFLGAVVAAGLLWQSNIGGRYLGQLLSNTPIALRIASLTDGQCSTQVDAVVNGMSAGTKNPWFSLARDAQNAFVTHCAEAALPADTCKEIRLKQIVNPITLAKAFALRKCTSVPPRITGTQVRCSFDQKLAELVSRYGVSGSKDSTPFQTALESTLTNWCSDCTELLVAAGKTYSYKFLGAPDGGNAYIKSRIMNRLLQRGCIAPILDGIKDPPLPPPPPSSSSSSLSSASAASVSSKVVSSLSSAKSAAASASSTAQAISSAASKSTVASSAPAASAGSSSSCASFCRLRSDGIRECKNVCSYLGLTPDNLSKKICTDPTVTLSFSCVLYPQISCEYVCGKKP